jgi:hypothetical protein
VERTDPLDLSGAKFMYFGERHTPSKVETDDRRAVMRRHLIYYLRVWDRNTDKLLGHIVDINTGGFMLISEKKVELEQAFDLEIRWNDPDDNEVKIEFKAESRWSSNDVNSAFFDTGFKLLGPTDDVLEPIKKMIEEYGFQD